MIKKIWLWQYFYFLVLFAISARTYSSAIADYLSWNSFIEVESLSYAHEAVSDEAGLNLGTIQSGWSFESRYLSAYLYGYYRKGVTDGIEPSQAQVFLNPFSSVYLGVGRAYLSFGHLETYAASDTPASSVGYSLKDNIQLGWFGDSLYAVVYAFESHLELANRLDDKTSYGASMSYAHSNQSFRVGLSYLSNMADSDLFTAILNKNAGLEWAVPMTAAHAAVYWKGFQVFAEQISATKPFAYSEEFSYLSDKTPSFNNIELMYFLSASSWLTLGHRTTRDADFTGLPQAASVLGYTGVFYGGGLRWRMELQKGNDYPSFDYQTQEYVKHQFSVITVKTEFSF